MLFIIPPKSISITFRKINTGYKIGRHSHFLDHEFIMDDFKIFAKFEIEINSLVYPVKVCPSDIGMKFGMLKCTTLVIKRRKKVPFNEINLIGKLNFKKLQKSHLRGAEKVKYSPKYIEKFLRVMLLQAR